MKRVIKAAVLYPKGYRSHTRVKYDPGYMINIAANYMLESSPLREYILTDIEFYKLLSEALRNLIKSNNMLIFHHIDEDRKNNEPNNILLISRAAHTSLHSAKTFAKIVNLLGCKDSITSIYDERAYRQELSIMKQFIDSYLYNYTLDSLSDILKAREVVDAAASDYLSFQNDSQTFSYTNVTAFKSISIPCLSYSFLNNILSSSEDIGFSDAYDNESIRECIDAISSLMDNASPECQDIYKRCLNVVKHLND